MLTAGIVTALLCLPGTAQTVRPKQLGVSQTPTSSKVVATAAQFASSSGLPSGSWQPITNQFPAVEVIDPSTGTDYGPGYPFAPLLMTDGGVLFQTQTNYGAGPQIFKLSPDVHGSYLNGTWSRLADKPYLGYAGSQAVLADGRVLLEGGEYSGYVLQFTLTNQGAIYDPASNVWKSVAPPSFFVDLYPPRAVFAPNPIGDSQNVVLPDGTFMLADKMSHQAALLNLKTLTWTETGTSTKNDLNDEEGWTLLPNGKVLTVDCYTDFFFNLVPSYPANPTNSELYDPETGRWKSAGSTINTLTDPLLNEIGPAILRPDGTVFALGSSGNSSIYDERNGWKLGPTLPVSPQGYQYTAQDAAGVLLPNGNVLVTATGGPEPAGGGYSQPPVGFFEFDGSKFIPEPTITYAAYDTSSGVQMLTLPNGQVLATDGNDIEVYTPANNSHRQSWEPVITDAPSFVSTGKTYRIEGVRFNGMSQACAFGDELQCATNYPLVRMTNVETQHVFYSRTHNHSSMAVASDEDVSTFFDVPSGQEKGLNKLEVVANGIASEPVWVIVN